MQVTLLGDFNNVDNIKSIHILIGPLNILNIS